MRKGIDDAWHKRDLEAAYKVYSDDIVFQRIHFPPVVGKKANMEADVGTLAAVTGTRCVIIGKPTEAGACQLDFGASWSAA